MTRPLSNQCSPRATLSAECHGQLLRRLLWSVSWVFSSVLENRPIQTLTNLQKETFIDVSYGDVRRHSIGPPHPNTWLGRSSCWNDRASLWVCDYVRLHGKSYLEHLPVRVALNNTLAVETNNSAAFTKGVLTSGTSCVVWWLEGTIQQSLEYWFNLSCCCIPAWPSFCCRLWWRW